MSAKQPINDLQEAIVNLINTHIKEHIKEKDFYNKDLIFIKFLDTYDQICFTPNPGSHMIEEDYSGLQFWQYNYTFTVETQHRADAKNRLFEISEYLQLLNSTKELVSEKDAWPWWQFDHIEIPSAPAEIMEDLKGTATYNMDVAVFVYKQKGVF